MGSMLRLKVPISSLACKPIPHICLLSMSGPLAPYVVQRRWRGSPGRHVIQGYEATLTKNEQAEGFAKQMVEMSTQERIYKNTWRKERYEKPNQVKYRLGRERIHGGMIAQVREKVEWMRWAQKAGYIPHGTGNGKRSMKQRHKDLPFDSEWRPYNP